MFEAIKALEKSIRQGKNIIIVIVKTRLSLGL